MLKPLALVCLVAISMMAASPQIAYDRSTPQESYLSFVEALSSGDAEQWAQWVTPTGREAIEALSDQPEGPSLPDLAAELHAQNPEWDQLTDDISLARVEAEGHVHKLQFVLEDTGWYLYHWAVLDSQP